MGSVASGHLVLEVRGAPMRAIAPVRIGQGPLCLGKPYAIIFDGVCPANEDCHRVLSAIRHPQRRAPHRGQTGV